MRKLIFIGKMNDVVKGITGALSTEFAVQLCANVRSVAQAMIDMTGPEIIVVSLIGDPEPFKEIMSMLRDEYSSIPVITIGTESESSNFAVFYKSGQFQNATRPISNNDLIERIKRTLGDNVSAPAEPSGGNDENKKSILVVDDNAATLRSIKSMLEDEYNVSIVPSGVKAMAMIGKNRPDLILLDYEMPVADGKQTLEMIRAEEDFADIPVIFLTGVSDKEHIFAVMELKPKGYLLKPPVREKLIEAIEGAIGK